MGYDNGEEQTTKCTKNTQKQSTTTMDNKHKILRYLWIPPPQTILTFIIYQHTSMRSHTQALRTHSQSKDLTFNGGLTQTT